MDQSLSSIPLRHYRDIRQRINSVSVNVSTIHTATSSNIYEQTRKGLLKMHLFGRNFRKLQVYKNLCPVFVFFVFLQLSHPVSEDILY